MSLRVLGSADWAIVVALKSRDPETGILSAAPIDLGSASASIVSSAGVALGVGSLSQPGDDPATVQIVCPASGRAAIDFGDKPSLLAFVDLMQAGGWIGRVALTIYKGVSP
jgi:hypothetical protein